MTAAILVPILSGVIWTLALSAAALVIGMVLGAGLCALRTSGNRLFDALAGLLIYTVAQIIF